MKKALSVFLMTAMAFGAFAQDAEPVADVNIAEFSGNAAVQWGVDLDTMKTGFKNSYEVNLKLNLLNNGTKSTTGDGVWGELVLKTEEDTFIGWENGDDSPEMNDEYINANTGLMGDGRSLGLKVYVDTAKIHIGPAYIGIKRGDTQTGELKMDAAIRSADDDQSKWLENVGPAKYSEGIVLGLDTEVVKLDLDLRSYAELSGTQVKHETDHTTTTFNNGHGHEDERQSHQYSDAYAAALEAELKGDGIGVEGLSVKGGVSFNFAENYYPGDYAPWKTAFDGVDMTAINTLLLTGNFENFVSNFTVPGPRKLGYSASVGYKLGLDDTFYIRPQVGFTGSTAFFKEELEVMGNKGTVSANQTTMAMAAGLLFGWGEIGMDQDAGVYYLDDDHAKKVSPGVGLVAYIPLANVSNGKMSPEQGDEYTMKVKRQGKYSFRMMPSFYSGELVPGLTAAAYADIVFMNEGGDTEVNDSDTSIEAKIKPAAANKDGAMAFALGAQYAIPVGEMTITPKLGVRFANASYADNYNDFAREKDDGVFGDAKTGVGGTTGANAVPDGKMGRQQRKADGLFDGNFMNLKLGVDVGGLIDNTTLSVIWETKNILNDYSYGDGVGDVARFGPKLGTLNFKAKIAL